MSTGLEPWRDLPPSLAERLEPALPEVTREILDAIRREVSEYARPLEGDFGHAVRTGVDEALRRFIALIHDPDAPDDGARRTSFVLGRAEFGAGRGLDALQSAYRTGARVAWRRFASVGAAAGFEQGVLTRLAEAIFAYIDGLSADSVEGYAQAQSERAGEHEERRSKLVATLLGDDTGFDAPTLSRQIGWALPRRAAAIACSADRLAGLSRRLGTDTLAGRYGALGCIVVPDAEGPGRREQLRAAGRRGAGTGGRRGVAAIGPEVDLDGLAHSWRLAGAALELAGGEELLVAVDHLGTLLVRAGASVVAEIAARRLAPLAELTPAARVRMEETALAYVQHLGNAAAMARELHLHPQTARYRIARLRELLGDHLDSPDARFEIEAALRAGRVR